MMPSLTSSKILLVLLPLICWQVRLDPLSVLLFVMGANPALLYIRAHMYFIKNLIAKELGTSK